LLVMSSRMDNRVSIGICNDSQQSEDVLKLGLNQSDDGEGCILSNRLIAVFWESFSFCSHRFRFPYISLELYLERASNLVAIGSFPRLYALELIKITRGGVDDEQASTHFELVGSNLYSSMIVGHGFLGFLVSFLFTRLVTFIDDILLPFVGDVTRWVKMVTNTRVIKATWATFTKKLTRVLASTEATWAICGTRDTCQNLVKVAQVASVHLKK
ncbi:hypothetical protein Tco_1259714, partial [Tanacetum coccineum]